MPLFCWLKRGLWLAVLATLACSSGTAGDADGTVQGQDVLSDGPRDMTGNDGLVDQVSSDIAGTDGRLDLGPDVAEDDWQIEETFDLPDITDPELPFPVLNEVGCHGDDFIELYNRSEQAPADLSGYVLADGVDALHRFVIPAGTIVAAKGRVLIRREATDLPGFPFGIQCGVDTIKLLNPKGELVDGVNLGLVMKGNTHSRLPDGIGDWAEASSTPDAPNAPPINIAGILFNPMQVGAIDLVVSQQALEMLDAAPDVYVGCTFSMETNGLVQEPMEVGLRLKGKAGSLLTPGQKPGLKLKFNFANTEQRFLGLKKLTLNSMTKDPSMIRETLAYRLFGAFNVPSPRTGYAMVTVNGEPFGLYLVLEQYDDVSMSRHFSSTQHLYEGDSDVDVLPSQVALFEVDEGDTLDTNDLAAFAAAAATVEDSAWMTEVQKVADLDELLREWAVEEYIGHVDGYVVGVQNYYLQSTDSGQFSMLPISTDQAFVDVLEFYSGSGYLFARCMAIPDCRSKYEQTLGELLPILDALGSESYAQQLFDFLEPWVGLDAKKPFTLEQAATSVQVLQSFLLQRQVGLEQLLLP